MTAENAKISRNIYNFKILHINTFLSFSELFTDKNNLPVGWIGTQWKYENWSFKWIQANWYENNVT